MPKRTKDVAYLNVIHNKIVYDEGNGGISSYTETRQLTTVQELMRS